MRQALTLSVVFVLALAGRVPAGTIGLDSRNGDSVHGPATGSGLTEYRACIVALGHDIVERETFTAADLAGLDAFILHHPVAFGNQFTGEEIEALHAFVAAGGGLLFHSTGGLSSSQLTGNVNQLMAPYGVVYDHIPNSPDGLEIVDLVAHAVTSGVTSFGVDYQRSMTAATPGLDLTVGSGEQNALAVRDGFGGAGNVAMLSDITGFTDAAAGQSYSIDDFDTKQLLRNLITYIAGDSAECFLVIGENPGLAPYLGASHLFTTQVGPEVEASYPVTMTNIPEFVLPGLGSAAMLAGGSATTRAGTAAALPAWMADGRFTVQVLMWNPQVFPAQPEQCSAGLDVQVLAGGEVVTRPYGASFGGIDLWAEVTTNAEGQTVLRFPFSILGF